MSLHDLANHIQSAGRGDDKVLVHMTPGEVKGLQSIAMAHGGSLTINPETGLPEAGFLSSILPMIAGFALGPAGLGLTAMQAGVASTALGTLLTGDLKQGVMAGLGAYGGAGLGQGLMAQGTAAVPTTTPAVSASVPTPVQSTAGDIFAQGGRFGNVGAVNTAVNPLQGGMTGFQAGVSSVSPTAQGLTSANMAIDPTAYVKPTIYPDVSSMPPGGSYAQLGPGRYTVSGPGGFPVNAPAATSSTGMPTEARIPTPVEKGVVRSEVYPGAPDPSVPVRTYTGAISDRMAQLGQGAKTSFSSTEGLKGLYNAMPEYSVLASGATLATAMQPEAKKLKKDKSLIRPYEFDYNPTGADLEPYTGSAERTYFQPQLTALKPYAAPGPEYAAKGGLMGLAVGGAVENMAAQNAIGTNTGYPMAYTDTPMYSNPAMQRPQAANVIAPSADTGVDTYTGEAKFAAGGISHLGDYSDGGRLLKGPGDGVSDSIPASIGNRQPARLADGEFVVPARIVSEIGNGSTEAGARKLYAMMDRVQKARRKTVGKDQVARNTKAEKLLPA